MGGNENCSNSSLKECTKESSRENSNSLTEDIKILYEHLQEIGYLITDLYDMDMKELQSTLINRRKGIANECFMIGMLSRTALSNEIPNTPEEIYPYMYPPKKRYVMPDFLKQRAIETLKERGGKFAR